MKEQKKQLQKSVTQQFESMVNQVGDKPAIQTANRTLSYTQLNEQANQLAHYILAQCGEGSEPIALLFGYEDWMVVALLAVLKTGKYYIPVDPSFPPERVQIIFEDCGAKLILTNQKYLPLANDSISIGNNVQISSVETAGSTFSSKFSSENPNLTIASDSLAYIIYTSGSTGKPKGVMHNRDYIPWLVETYTASGEMKQQDRFALMYSLAFTGAVRDIYCSLLNGATLLPLDVKKHGIAKLRHWMIDNQITAAFFVATLFRHFCHLLNDKQPGPPLRLIEIGSETVLATDAMLYKRHFSDSCKFIVNLGGTEISPISQFSINKDTPIDTPLHAGKPVEGVQVLLLDDQKQAVEDGQVGEIVVRSQHLARGYWKRPQATALQFTQDPTDHSQCLYHTGDLGRRLADGSLLHMGRKDFQLKVRGYRIESSDVESALLALEYVQEAAVAAPQDANGDCYLLAYIVPAELGASLCVAQLRAQLKSTLADYMIPTAVMLLERLPLTDTGKVDRRALPISEKVKITQAVQADDAQSDTQRLLSQLWSELFNLQKVSIHDNFFNLGGHSLSATQLVSRIRTLFTVELALPSIFEHPVLADQAKLIEIGKPCRVDTAIPPLNHKLPMPLSFAQQRLWFLAQLTADEHSATYNMSRVFRLQGALNVAALRQSLCHIAERHLSLRSCFRDKDQQLSIQISAPYDPLIEIELAGDLDTQLQLQANQGYDLTQGHLLRAHLFKCSESEHVLLLAMHHIASDGWSIGVLIREWSKLYTSYSENRPSTLAALPIQYPDYAGWQRNWLSGEVLESQLDFWRKQLDGCPELLELPTDFPRPAIMSNRGARHTGQLPHAAISKHILQALRGITRI